MKEVLKKYKNNEIKYEKWQIIGILCLVIVISGIVGWLYEFIFYYFNGGMKEFYVRGGNFLPWINIYAIGAVLIILTTYKFKNNAFLVFIISFIVTGILEYFSGLAIYKISGLRFWNYNTEILNFGNIDGFVCLRSVLIFGLGGILLMKVLLPSIKYISTKMNKKKFLIISITLCTLVICDEIYNLVITKLFNLPNANEVYKSIGFHTVK